MGNPFIQQQHLTIRLIITLFCFTVVSGLAAQGNLAGLESFNLEGIDHQRKAMMTLGGWAVVNISSGLILSNQKNGPDKYFHRMNAYWNVVNLGIAGIGYFSAIKQDPSSLDLYASVDSHFGFQRVLLLNAGLDVGYVLGGLYLTERSRRFINDDPKKADQLKGFGQSIMLQGGFLFLFDVANHLISAGRNNDLKLLMTETGVGLSWTF